MRPLALLVRRQWTSRRVGTSLGRTPSSADPERTQALDSALKAICTALLESDVNVKLVKNLRERVKVKVLPQLVEIQKKSSGDALAGNKGKQLIHKVIRATCGTAASYADLGARQTVFDELVALVDPGDLAPPAFDVGRRCMTVHTYTDHLYNSQRKARPTSS